MWESPSHKRCSNESHGPPNHTGRFSSCLLQTVFIIVSMFHITREKLPAYVWPPPSNYHVMHCCCNTWKTFQSCPWCTFKRLVTAEVTTSSNMLSAITGNLPKLPLVYFQALDITATSYEEFKNICCLQEVRVSRGCHGVRSSPWYHQPTSCDKFKERLKSKKLK